MPVPVVLSPICRKNYTAKVICTLVSTCGEVGLGTVPPAKFPITSDLNRAYQCQTSHERQFASELLPVCCRLELHQTVPITIAAARYKINFFS